MCIFERCDSIVYYKIDFSYLDPEDTFMESMHVWLSVENPGGLRVIIFKDVSDDFSVGQLKGVPWLQKYHIHLVR